MKSSNKIKVESFETEVLQDKEINILVTNSPKKIEELPA